MYSLSEGRVNPVRYWNQLDSNVARGVTFDENDIIIAFVFQKLPLISFDIVPLLG